MNVSSVVPGRSVSGYQVRYVTGPISYHYRKKWISGQEIKLWYNTLTAFSSLSQKSYSEGCDMKCWQGRAQLKNFQTLTSVCIFLVILLVFPVHRKTGCFKIYLVVTIPHFKCMFQLAWFCFSKLGLWFVVKKAQIILASTACWASCFTQPLTKVT